MKRFFAIFGICLAALLLVIGGFVGIKYLIGDYDPEVILPEDIAFDVDKTEYYLNEGSKHYITITTTTKGVTETKVNLALEQNCRETIDKNYWTDGVVIIPKIAHIGEPFEVQLVKDNTYYSELNDDALNNWVRGGISKIIAQSKNILNNKAYATVYVDTPVYKTELVIFDREQTNVNFDAEFKNLESSNFATKVPLYDAEINADQFPSVNSGQTIYVGLRYYPSASAFKYSKASSTNMLVEYKKQIQDKLNDLNIEEDIIEQIENLCLDQENIDVNSIVDLYKQLLSSQMENSELNTFFTNLLEKYNSCLKYNFVSNLSDETLEFKGRVFGTNLFEFVAKQNLSVYPSASDFYSYSFKNANKQDEANLLPDSNNFDILESAFESGNAIRNRNRINIVDVEVDTIKVNGNIANFITDKTHTIYASKLGANNATTSYLRIDLSNSILSQVDLSHKIKNVGIKFQKKVESNWMDTDEIKFEDDGYKTIIFEENGSSSIYYLSYGDANYWRIYTPTNITGEYRVVVKYFIESVVNPNTYTAISIADDTNNPKFNISKITELNENTVSWKSLDEIDLKSVNITTECLGDTNKTFNDEYDLSSNVNFEEVNSNVYTTIRYFIYSNDDETLKNYFDVLDSVKYTFKDGQTLYLYELKSGSSILKLKGNTIPEHPVYAMFLTIRTDRKGAPIYVNSIEDIAGTPDNPNDDVEVTRYDYIKYSAVKDNQLERVSSLQFTFTKSLSGLDGNFTININNQNHAGVVKEIINDEEVDVLKVAKNTENVFTVTVKNTDNEELFKKAIEKGEISIVGKTSHNAQENYIEFNEGVFGSGEMTYVISTLDVSADTVISFYIKYSIAGKNYYFEVPYKENNEISTLTIVYNTASNAKFAVTHDSNIIESKDIKNISVSATLDAGNNLTYAYKLTKTDNEVLDVTTDDIYTNYNNNLYIKSLITSFLGGTIITDEWYLKSDNNNVAVIQEDGKTINFVGAGEAKISIYLNGSDDKEQDSITFVVGDMGYVSEYTTNDENGAKTSNLENGEYKTKTFELSVVGNGNSIKLQTGAEDTELLEMYYKLGTQDPKKISFKITLADEDSINAYNNISNTEYDEDNGLTVLSFKKSLGETVVLNLLYNSQGIDGIKAKVILTIRQYISVKNIAVKTKTEKDGEEVTINVDPIGNSGDSIYTYKVYAGKQYTIDAELINSTEEIYFWYKDNSEYSAIGDKTDKLDYDSSDIGTETVHTFIFKDVSKDTTYEICISNNSAIPEIGDLQRILKIIVQPNVSYATSLINNGNGYSKRVELLDDATQEILLSDLFVRQELKSEALDNTKFKIESRTGANDDEVKIDVNNILFNFSVGKIENYRGVTIKLSYSGKMLSPITFNIYPKNYEIEENDDYRVVKYNGEKAFVLVDNVDEFKTENSKTLPENIGGFFNIDTNIYDRIVMDDMSEYNDGGKVVSNSNSLLTDTNKYIKVKDEVGNYTKYRLIISKLGFPFVNIKTNGFKTSDLDIYKLFVNPTSEDLKNYYTENGLYVGNDSGFYGGDNINLIKENSEDRSESIYNLLKDNVSIYDSANLSISFNFVESNLEAQDYIKKLETGGDELQTSLVGETVYLYVALTYNYGSNVYLTIPTIIKINQSQSLEISYPFDERNSESVDKAYFESDTDATNNSNRGWYGSDAYDNQYMTESTSAFSNAVMEYIAFDINGKAELELTNERFVVKNWNGTLFEKDPDYEGGFYFEALKVYALSKTWTQVDGKNINNFVSISGNKVEVFKRDTNGLRIKIKVTSLVGDSTNYYYIQVGDLISVQLYKQVEGTEIRANSNEILQVKQGDLIIIENDNSLTDQTESVAKYYIKENYNQIKFVTSEEIENKLFVLDGKKITIKLVPNGATFTITVYTMYGVLSTITVNIEAYYKATKVSDDINTPEKEDIIYSGKKYDITDFVSFKTSGGEDVPSEDISLNGIETSNYWVTEGKIVFRHSLTDYTVKNFVIYVNIGSDKFKVEIPSIDVTVGITTDYVNNPYQLGDKNESAGKITIAESDLSEVFTLQEGEFDGIVFALVYLGETIEISEERKYTISVGTITTETTINLQYIIIATHGEYEVEFVANISVKVSPQYTVEINYSQGVGTSFTEEYIEEGSEFNFAGKNINGIDRIIVKNTDPDGDGRLENIYYVLKTEGGETIQKYAASEEKTYTFNSECDEDGKVTQYGKGTYYVDIIYDEDGDGTGPVYGTYCLNVGDNPIGIETYNIDNQTFFAGYGETDVLNYVDVIVTLPPIEIEELAEVSIVAKIPVSDEEYIYEELSKVYYLKTSKIIRLAIPLEKYIKGVNASNIYMAYTVGEEQKYELCSAQITERYGLLYNGAKVALKDYSNIIETTATGTPTEEGAKTYSIVISGEIDNVTSLTQTVFYNVTCDIQFTNIDTKNTVTIKGENYNVHYEFNANEFSSGISIVSEFGIKDMLGNQFGLNNLGEDKSFNLNYGTTDIIALNPNDSTGNAAPIRLEASQKNSITYDYKMIALGATNNGTLVCLTFTYKVKDITFTQTINVTIKSDIVVSVLNNDNFSTENSEGNVRALGVTAQYELSDSSQTDFRNNSYSIYAYGKYDITQKNVATSFHINVEGDLEFVDDPNLPIKISNLMVGGKNVAWFGLPTQTDADGNTVTKLLFSFNARPGFGDKLIKLVFTDDYGFTFYYHIKLIASTRVDQQTPTGSGEYFEGDSLKIFNENKETDTGIGLNIKNADETTDSDTELKIYKIVLSDKNKKDYVVAKYDKANSKYDIDIEDYMLIEISNYNIIKFSYQKQGYWNNTDDQRTNAMNLQIYVKKALNDEESFVIYTQVTLKRRYIFEIKEENTYVRDGVEFEIEHLVSVKDQKLDADLGEPTISDTAALKYNFVVNADYKIKTTQTTKVEFTYNVAESKTDTNAELNIQNEKIELQTLLLARANSNYTNSHFNDISVGSEGTVKIKYNNGTSDQYVLIEKGKWNSDENKILSNQVVDIILNALNIKYDEDKKTFTLYLSLVATNIHTQEKIESFEKSVLVLIKPTKNEGSDVYNGFDYSIPSLTYLGVDGESVFGTVLDSTNYTYQLIYNNNLNSDENAVVLYDTKTSTSTTDGIIKANGTATLVEATTVKVLKVVSGSDSDQLIYLQDMGSNEIHSVTIKRGKNTIYLENFSGKNMALYTGVSDGTIYYKGFTKELSLAVKNLTSVSILGLTANGGRYAVSLDENATLLENKNNDVLYQDVTNTFKYKFATHGDDDVHDDDDDDYEYKDKKSIRTTLKYTGIDASGAYVGTSQMHLINIEVNESKKITLNGTELTNINVGTDGNLIVSGSDGLTIGNSIWSQKFKVIPGVGNTAILASYLEKDELNLNHKNVNYLMDYKLKEITDTTNSDTTNKNLVEIDKTKLKEKFGTEGTEKEIDVCKNDIILKDGFVITQYYITIDIYCKYPYADPLGTDSLGTKSAYIGTIKIGFKVTYTTTAS